MRRVSLCLGMLALVSAAFAQKEGARLGVSVSAYSISDSRLRDVFGDPALTYGINLSSINRPRANKPAFAYNILSASRDDSTFFLLPLTVGYETQFAPREAKFLPYFRGEVGVAYYDIAIHDGGWNQSFKTGGFVAAAEAGLVFNKSVAIKARYNLFQEKFGVDMSGLEIGLTYVFGSF